MAEDAQGTSRLADPRRRRGRARSRLRDHRGAEGAAAAARSTLPEGTVYPALHRLERAGLLASGWSERSAAGAASTRLTRRGRTPARERARASGATSRAPSTRCSHELPRRAFARSSRDTGSAEQRAVASSAEVDDHLRSDAGRGGAFRLAGREVANAFAAELGVAGFAAGRCQRLRGARPSPAPSTPPRSSRWRSRARRPRR